MSSEPVSRCGLSGSFISTSGLDLGRSRGLLYDWMHFILTMEAIERPPPKLEAFIGEKETRLYKCREASYFKTKNTLNEMDEARMRGRIVKRRVDETGH